MNMRRVRRLVLLGAFGVENYGNDETLDAAITGVRDAAHRVGVDVELRCVCSDVEGIAARVGIPTMSLHGAGSRAWGTSSRLAPIRMAGLAPRTVERVVRAVRELRGVDRVCVAGTGTLDDQHISPWGLPLDVAVWSVAARLARTDLVFTSVGAGPIDHRASRFLYRTAARCARHVSYRDQRSKDYMRSVGRNVDRDTVAPDLVFGRREAARGLPADNVERPCVAVGVLWSGQWSTTAARTAYLDRLGDVVRRLWAAGFDVSLIEGDVHDRDAVTELAARLGPDAEGRLSVPRIRSFADVVEAVTPCAVTVASRYHHLVAAFVAGRPAVSLEYGFKNTAVMGDVGLAAFCHRIDDFSAAAVVEQVQQLTADRRLAQHVRCRVTKLHDLVDKQWELVVR
jgi:polysaccharide pyruvyl transferase WcaK-like protein